MSEILSCTPREFLDMLEDVEVTVADAKATGYWPAGLDKDFGGRETVSFGDLAPFLEHPEHGASVWRLAEWRLHLRGGRYACDDPFCHWCRPVPVQE